MELVGTRQSQMLAPSDSNPHVFLIQPFAPSDEFNLNVLLFKVRILPALHNKTLIRYFLILYNTNMDFDKLCKDILGLDSKVRFAGVCDDSGGIKYGGQREGITNLLSPDETRRSNLQAMARWALRSSLSSKIGKGKYAMSEYQKIKRITFPLEQNHLLLVTTEVDADHNKIIKDVLTMVR
jgi:hypothetical protein